MTATSVAGSGMESSSGEGLQRNAIDPYANVLRFTAPIVGVWMLIGIVLYLWLRMRNPSALQRMGQIYGGEGSPPE